MPIQDLNQCDKACIGCIRQYKTKHDLKAGQSFNIRCDGIPKDHIPLSILNSIQPEDQEMAKALLDPVIWAAQTLDWHCLDPDGEIWKRKNPEEYEDWIEKHPGESILGHSRYHRPYQAEMLRCTAKRKVFRIGRQAGKCLIEGTMVNTPTGPVAIETLKPGDTVIGWNKDDTISPCKVVALHNQGIQEVVDLTHFNIPLATCTIEHRFLTTRQWNENKTKEVKKIKDFNTNTGIVRKWYKSSLGKINEPHAYAIGALLGDGCSREKGRLVYISSEDRLIPEKIAGILNTTYSKCSVNNYTWKIKTDSDNCNYYNEWIKNRYAHEKTLDLQVIKTWNRESCLALLAGLLDTDGSVSEYNNILQISISMQAKPVIEVVQYLLLALFQYQANIGCDNREKYKNGAVWTIKCANNLFSKKILYELDSYLVIPRKKWKSSYSDLLENNSHTDYVGIKTNNTRSAQCWDITVDNETNLYCLANGLVTHNTESLVISILFNMFTKPGVPDNEGFKVIIITPYQSQIDLVFNRILELINSSIITTNSLKRHVKAPTYTVELHNGSIVRGFTAGTKSAGNAEAVRGQAAQMLVFDEADYLASGDMDAALAIITNHPTATVWMSSTPSGKHERFYEACRSERYKEFHFPSSCNPLWSADLEADFREQLTEVGYTHECDANFGEQEEGVFQNSYIQVAKEDYNYGDFPPNHAWTYTVGVDWNDTKHGTTINVLGFNPNNNLFYIVDRKVVSREGWTQLTACHTIADLNRIWRPIAIYVDKGFGGTQIEVLRNFGFESMANPEKGPLHPDAALRNIIKPYDFGSSIEIKDLFTKQPVKKYAKGFLVESTVRRFEANDLRFSSNDTELEAELHGYVIDRVTPTGNPVYKANEESVGDHALDALMLSVVAFILEATPFGKPKHSVEIGFTGRIGEKTTTDILQGDLVVKNDKPKNIRESSKPDKRDIEQLPLFENRQRMPANHITCDTPKLWSWDGFGHDAPRPNQSGKTRLGQNNKGGRPSRKNI